MHSTKRSGVECHAMLNPKARTSNRSTSIMAIKVSFIFTCCLCTCLIMESDTSPNGLFSCQSYGAVEGNYQSWQEISPKELSRSFPSGRNFDRTPEVHLDDPPNNPRS
jgi:hypothetical protein